MRKIQRNIQGRYMVSQISREDAVNKLNKRPNISYAFGLFDNLRNKALVAVATFGSPPSPAIIRGLCGEDEMYNIIELNSMWVASSVSNDAVVYFLRKCLTRIPQNKDIVLSYVPNNIGERVSRIFKQLGFLYTGLTKERTNRVDKEGNVRYNRSKDYDPMGTYLVPRPRKHRFVLFNTKDVGRVKELLDKLRYEVYTY